MLESDYYAHAFSFVPGYRVAIFLDFKSLFLLMPQGMAGSRLEIYQVCGQNN
jgi:hypothetical protein